MKKSVFVCFFGLIGCLSPGYSAIVLGGGGTTGLQTFDAIPAAADWSTISTGIAGDQATINSVATLNTFVASLTAATVSNTLGSSTTNPPSANAAARWNGTNFYLQTRPTGVAATVLMATLANGSGSSVTGITLAYDLGRTNANPPTAAIPEVIDNHILYYSLTGLANSWEQMTFSSSLNTTPGTVVPTLASQTLSSPWLNGSNLYLLWADDNVDGTDDAFTIDNFTVRGIPEPGAGLLAGIAAACGLIVRRRR